MSDNQVIPEAAVDAAAKALAICDGYTESSWAARANDPEYGHGYYANVACLALEAAAPHMAAQALADAVDAFPLETITAPDNAVVWLMRRAEEMNPRG